MYIVESSGSFCVGVPTKGVLGLVAALLLLWVSRYTTDRALGNYDPITATFTLWRGSSMGGVVVGGMHLSGSLPLVHCCIVEYHCGCSSYCT